MGVLQPWSGNSSSQAAQPATGTTKVVKWTAIGFGAGGLGGQGLYAYMDRHNMVPDWALLGGSSLLLAIAAVTLLVLAYRSRHEKGTLDRFADF